MKDILIVLIPLLLLGGVAYCWFLPGLILECAKHAIRWWAGLERHEVRVEEHRWVYLAGGKGEAIAFIQGFGADKDGWGTFLLGFSDSYRLIAPDLPGFGESSQVDSASYDIPSQVSRLNHFVETIGLDSFHMVGVSMGGYISAYYASEYPEKVKSLALIDAAGVNSRITSYAWRLYKEEGKNLLLYKTAQQFDELMQALFYRPPWIPGQLKDYFVQRRARNYDFHEKIVNDIMNGGMDLLERRLPKIQAKTLIIWGANDLIIHVSSVEKFQCGIKNSQTVIIDNCGHVPFLEKSKETKRAYRRFLASL
jgi:abhydrolase domain-containing protein 6